jgi:hypothetical protein
MMKHCTSRYEIEAARLHWSSHDISLAQLQIWQVHVDQRKIKVDSYGSTIWSDSPCQPRGD